jgi:hypothetical protein
MHQFTNPSKSIVLLIAAKLFSFSLNGRFEEEMADSSSKCNCFGCLGILQLHAE